MEQFWAAITTFFTVENVLALVLGQAIGVIVGAIPGLTVTMAIVLVLPFTYSMSAITALLMLVGIYKAGIYAGSISAVLVRAPGTPASACTVLDGWPLARQGKARKALDMSLYASCVADFISNLALLLFAGLIASFALRFGPSEMFWLIAFALTVVPAVSGDSLPKGLMSASIGILLSTVGMDLVTGTPRLTFDLLPLAAGLSLVPLLIGLFAVSEVFDFYSRERTKVEESNSGGAPLTFEEFKQSLPAICRGGLIGVVVGAIPGIGSGIASFLSYADAKRRSKRGAYFGKGELEGIAASEAGNNGVAGSTLIPLLALGIPGDVVTAVMLGAFLIHDLNPGPLLFTRHGEFVYALLLGIMLSSLVLLFLGKIAVPLFSRTGKIPPQLLMPIVLVFCVFGAYSINNSGFDVLVMLAAGVLGFGMNRWDMPAAPMLIGFILGPLLEDNLRRTELLARGDYWFFVQSPLTWPFIALTLLSLALGFRRRRIGIVTP